MARFFFDLDHGEGLLRDHEGTEHANLAAAQTEATETLTDYGKNAFVGRQRARLRMLIRDENEATVMRVELAFAANPLPRSVNGGRVR